MSNPFEKMSDRGQNYLIIGVFVIIVIVIIAFSKNDKIQRCKSYAENYRLPGAYEFCMNSHGKPYEDDNDPYEDAQPGAGPYAD